MTFLIFVFLVFIKAINIGKDIVDNVFYSKFTNRSKKYFSLKQTPSPGNYSHFVTFETFLTKHLNY